MDDAERFQAAVRAQLAGNLIAAERVYCELLERDDTLVPALVNLGGIRLAEGRCSDAIELLERAVDLAPEHVNARCQLGLAYARSGQHRRADTAYAEVLALKPDHLGALNNRALSLGAMRRFEEALEHYRRALAIDPSCREAHQNLGSLCSEVGRLGDARRHLEEAIRLAPDEPGPRVNMSRVLVRMGRAREGLLHLVRALTSPQATAAWHSNLLLDLHYAEGSTREELFAEHRAWARIRVPPPPRERPRPTDEPGRRLRVGYVSPDLRSHAVAFFLEPLLAHHDRTRVEVFAYASVESEDATTGRLRSLVDRWQNVFSLSDLALAEQVRTDGIDVLVDLAGHTAGHRLGAFALAPAPVQMTYLGYPDTTGLDAIDYRITDRHCDPPGSEAFHAETLLFVQGGMHCYRPPDNAPAPAPPPFVDRGHLTFGSFNNTSKITERVIGRFCEVLRALPSARFFMKFATLADPETAAHYLATFERHGVASDRVTLHGGTYGHGSHLAAHSEVDVILDAFPYHGTTTTCEALWMGVPVLTLVGDRHVARVGKSLLEQVGLASFALDDEAQWLSRAIGLDSDEGREELTALRTTTRERMRASPLCDGPTKARALEDLYEASVAKARMSQLASRS